MCCASCAPHFLFSETSTFITIFFGPIKIMSNLFSLFHFMSCFEVPNRAIICLKLYSSLFWIAMWKCVLKKGSWTPDLLLDNCCGPKIKILCSKNKSATLHCIFVLLNTASFSVRCGTFTVDPARYASCLLEEVKLHKEESSLAGTKMSYLVSCTCRFHSQPNCIWECSRIFA